MEWITMSRQLLRENIRIIVIMSNTPWCRWTQKSVSRHFLGSQDIQGLHDTWTDNIFFFTFCIYVTCETEWKSNLSISYLLTCTLKVFIHHILHVCMYPNTYSYHSAFCVYCNLTANVVLCATVCHPGMYVGGSCVTREPRDAQTGVCPCITL